MIIQGSKPNSSISQLSLVVTVTATVSREISCLLEIILRVFVVVIKGAIKNTLTSLFNLYKGTFAYDYKVG